MRIAVYIGSFNPPHKGHAEIGRSIVRYGLADRLLFVPTGNYWGKQSLLPMEHRIRMLQAACNREDMTVETQCNEIPYTADLMRALGKEYPGDELMLVLGADSLVKFDEWFRFRELLETYHFIVVNRDGYDTKKLLQRLGKRDAWIANGIPNLPYSSTAIRALQREDPILQKYMDPEVLKVYRSLEQTDIECNEV